MYDRSKLKRNDMDMIERRGTKTWMRARTIQEEEREAGGGEEGLHGCCCSLATNRRSQFTTASKQAVGVNGGGTACWKNGLFIERNEMGRYWIERISTVRHTAAACWVVADATAASKKTNKRSRRGGRRTGRAPKYKGSRSPA